MRAERFQKARDRDISRDRNRQIYCIETQDTYCPWIDSWIDTIQPKIEAMKL